MLIRSSGTATAAARKLRGPSPYGGSATAQLRTIRASRPWSDRAYGYSTVTRDQYNAGYRSGATVARAVKRGATCPECFTPAATCGCHDGASTTTGGAHADTYLLTGETV